MTLRLLSSPVTPRRMLAVLIAAVLIAGISGSFPCARTTSAEQADKAPMASSAQQAALNLEAGTIAAVQTVGPAVVSITSDNGVGSGVIYDQSGLVLTNAHVVDGATSLTVTLIDGRHFTGKVLGYDDGFDLAVVAIHGQNLPAASLGDSRELQVGQFVLAIGIPLGLRNTVTLGIISALNRPFVSDEASYLQPMIQTDAPINPGSSGGPLVDLAGNVVGINTVSRNSAQGIALAIPTDTVMRIIPQLVQFGHVIRTGLPYPGFSVAEIGDANSAPSQPTLSFGVEHGVVVEDVVPSSPAGWAGLRDGDIVVSLDGREVYDVDELEQSLILLHPGDLIQLGLIRGVQTLTTTVALGEVAAPGQPTLTSLSVDSAVQGGLPFVLTVNGSNFIADSVALWDGAERPTEFISSTQLDVSIGSGDIDTPGRVSVAVFNPVPGGGTSNALPFIVREITGDFSLSVSPSSRTVTQGDRASFTVTITPGGGFSSAVRLALPGAPTGVTGIFSPNPTSSSSTLTVLTSATVQPGSYTLTIRGRAGRLDHSTTVALVVNPR